MLLWLARLVLFLTGFNDVSKRTSERLRLIPASNHIVVCNQSQHWYERCLLYLYCKVLCRLRHVTFFDVHQGRRRLEDLVSDLQYWTNGRSVVLVAAGINYHPLIRTFHLGSRDYYSTHDMVKAWQYVCSALAVVYPLDVTCLPLSTPKPLHYSQELMQVSKVNYRQACSTYFVDLLKLSTLMYVIPALAALHVGLLQIFVLLIVVLVTNLRYHDSYEQHHYTANLVAMVVLLGHFLLRLLMHHTWDTFVSYGLSCLSLVHLFIGSMTRHETFHRSRSYINYRSALYTSVSLMMLWYCYCVEHRYI